MELATRYRIVGVEVVGIGAFALLLAFLEWSEGSSNSVVQNFTWVWTVVGITLILVGLEILYLNRLSASSKT